MSQFFQVFVLVMCILWAGCQGRGCAPSGSKNSLGMTCSLEKVLGTAPRWGGVCDNDRSCWRAERKRMRWVRCVTGRCVFGASDGNKGHLMGVGALWWGEQGELWSGDLGGELRRWDVAKGQTTLRWAGHRGAIRALAKSRGGWLISAGDDQVIRAWKGGHQKAAWKVRGRISALAISPDGHWLAAASTDRRIWVRSLVAKPGEARWLHWSGHSDAVRGVSFDASGRRLVSASDDRTVRLWAAPGGKLLRTFRGHQGWVRKAVFGPKGAAWVASGSFDLTIHIWDQKTGDLQQRWGRSVDPFGMLQHTRAQVVLPKPAQKTQIAQRHQSDISDVAVSADGQWLLSTGHRSAILRLPDDGTTARLWRRKDGQVVCHLKGHQLGLTAGRFAPQGSRFATASEDGTIRVYRYHRDGSR